MQLNNIRDMRALTISPSGDLFAFGSNDGRVRIYKVSSSFENLFKNRGSLDFPYHEFIFSSGVVCLAFGEGDINSRRLPERPPSRRYRDKKGTVTLLAVGFENGSIRIVDIEKRDVFLVLEDHKRSITSLSFSSSGSMVLASTGLDGTCKLWDLWDDGNMYRTLRDTHLDGKACHSCAWAPDCKNVCVTSGPHHGTLWDIEKFAVQGRLNGHKHRVTSCDFSPDNTLIATASMDTSVIVWERISCRPLRQFWHMGYKPSLIYLGGANGHYVTKVKFSPDGVHLVTVCDDRRVRFWDLEEGSDVEPEMKFATTVFGADDATFTDALISPRGDTLVMSGVDPRESLFCIAHVPCRQADLMHLCRSSIRHILSSEQINNLQLPGIMKKFLCFRHNQ